MTEKWQLWKDNKDYGELFRRRATGELPEMECAKATTRYLMNEVSAGDTILDVGCGCGHYLPTLQRVLGVPFHYTGIDPTEHYIRLARQTFAGENRVRFEVGDVYHLPCHKRSFNIVICANLLLHLPTISQPLSELCRVASKFVLVRTLVGDRSFIVKEVRKKSAESENAHQAAQSDEFDDGGSPRIFCYYNIYSASYIEFILENIPDVSRWQIFPDTDYDPEKIRNHGTQRLSGSTTNLVEGKQVLGYLILPWKFISIEKQG